MKKKRTKERKTKMKRQLAPVEKRERKSDVVKKRGKEEAVDVLSP